MLKYKILLESKISLEKNFYLITPVSFSLHSDVQIKRKHTSITPSMELTLPRWGGLSTKKFQLECVNKESLTERRR